MAEVFITLAIILVVCLWFSGNIISRRLGRTPFQSALQLAESQHNSNARTRFFDVFISYKSENSVLARQLAEQFVAADLIPWFAEYIIPIRERTHFRKAIDLGMANSDVGICLTDKGYYKSEHCRYELEHLDNPNTGALLGLFAVELSSVEDRLHRQIKWKKRVKFESLLKALIDLGCFPSENLPVFSQPVRPDRRTFSSPNGTYSLNLAGWDTQSRRPNAGGRDLWGPAFQRWFGSFLIWGHVIVGPQDTRIRRCLEAGIHNDRKYYEEALRFADHFFSEKLPQRCVGIHLLSHKGWSHVALTTFFRNTWSRVYSLVFPDRNGEQDVEYAFFFFAREPFREFCRYAFVMDELVLSLEPHNTAQYKD